MKKNRSAILAIMLAGSAQAQAPDAPSADICTVPMTVLSTIADRYQPEQQALQQEGEALGGDADKAKISGMFDVKMTERKIVFDIPSITMTTKRMSLDLPQTTMKTRRMSWDEPVTVMRRTKFGQKPEFKCKQIVKCTVKWTDIIIDVPTIEMRQRAIAMDVPEFRMDRTEFKADIPEVKMRRQDWSMKIPEITLRNPMLEAERLKRRGEGLATRADTLANRIDGDTAQSTSDLFGCYRDDVVAKRGMIANQFDLAIRQLEAGIGAVGGAGGDPSKVAGDGVAIDMIAQRDALVRQRAEALSALDAVLEDLAIKQKAAVEKVIA